MNAQVLPFDVAGADNAPALVLLHPIATHRAIWDLQVPVLSQRCRVIRMDLPGHGECPPPPRALDLEDYSQSVLATLDHLGVARFALLGLSFGGMVAQSIALAAPDRVSALILAHTSARTTEAVAAMWTERLADAETQGMDAQTAPTLERWFTPEFRIASPMTMHWVGDMIRLTSLAGYASAIGAIQRLDNLGRLSDIAVPSLVIAGEADTAIPVAIARTICETLTAGRLTILPAAAHLGNVEQNARFSKAVGEFLLSAC